MKVKRGAGKFFSLGFLCYYSICSNCFLVYYVSSIKVFIYSISSDIAGTLLMHIGLRLVSTATSRVTCQINLVIHLVTRMYAFDKNVFLPQVHHNRNVKD